MQLKLSKNPTMSLNPLITSNKGMDWFMEKGPLISKEYRFPSM